MSSPDVCGKPTVNHRISPRGLICKNEVLSGRLLTKVNINPPFMKEIFCERTVTYNLRNNTEFLLPRVRTTS